MKEMYRKQQMWREYLMRFQVLDFRYIWYQLHCHPWVPWIISAYALETFCVCFQSHLIVIQLLSHRLPLFFFFFPAPRLRVDTHSCFPCRVSPNQWYRATREPTGTDTAPAEGQSSSGRQCFPPHLVPVTGLQKVSTGTSTNPSPNNVALCAFLSFPGSLSFIPPFCLLESHPK